MWIKMPRVCYHCFHNIQGEGACSYCGYDPGKDEGKYPFALPAGTVLANRYILGRVLGQGGFGVTYVAFDQQTRSRVAIKEYLPGEIAFRTPGNLTLQVYSADQQEDFDYGRNQFLAEAKILSEFVGNDHIVGILSFFEGNGTAYFAMEYMEGQTLKQYLLERNHPLTVAEANKILLPIMEALDWVHSKGIIHRDISPDNIMLRKDGTAKLIDFGAARNSTSNKSRSLDVILKPGFAPLEQYTRRGRQGPYTDVYAMAATYYYSITGKVPPDAIERSEEDTLIPPSKLGVKLSQDLENTLLRALNVSATGRYLTMRAFYQDMMQASMDSEALNRDRKKKRKLGAGMALLALAAVLTVVFFFPDIVPFIRRPEETEVIPNTEVSPETPSFAEPAETVVTNQNTEAEEVPEQETVEQPVEEPKHGMSLVSGDYDTPGSIVRFGAYEQDNNTANGKEQIDWIIVDRTEDGHLMLVSERALDYQAFNYGGDPYSITWGNSTLRNWLNDDFFEAAFSQEEMDAILLTQVNNNHYQGNLNYRHRDWEDTEDHVFLLSYAEAWKYFPVERERVCQLTEYAKSLGAYINKDNQSGYWWLRSPGVYQCDISLVNPTGEVKTTDIDDEYSGIAVRPALWVDLNALEIDPAEKGNDAPEFGSVGSTVVYGQYEQDNELENGKEDVEWIVLAEDGDRRLLLSKKGLERHKYNDNGNAVFWENCALRAWLNGEFYQEAFTEKERKNILNTLVDNSKYQHNYKEGDGNKSMDKLFLLSYTEVMHYLPKEENRACEFSDYAVSQKNGSTAQKWWLRTRGRLQQDCIDGSGKPDKEGITSDAAFVRPAMWIEIDALRGEDTSGRTKDVSKFREIGNVVRFGQYEQDNDLENGKEDIDWLVLDTNGNSSLLISRFALDHQQYHNVNVYVYWDGSKLRDWLNEDFYQEAFDEEERQAIITSSIGNCKEGEWAYWDRGVRTNDKVFLLSYREAWSYFKTFINNDEYGDPAYDPYDNPNYERTCAGTPYANRDQRTDLHAWWLRSAGKTADTACAVSATGQNENRVLVNRGDYLVRPVIQVDLDLLEKLNRAG